MLDMISDDYSTGRYLFDHGLCNHIDFIKKASWGVVPKFSFGACFVCLCDQYHSMNGPI